MKTPEQAPDPDEIFKEFMQRLVEAKTDATRSKLLRTPSVESAEVQGRYLHWDDLRRRPPPPGLTHQLWWWRLCQVRTALRSKLPLRAMDGRPFHFARLDRLQRLLHEVDRSMAGSLQALDPSLTSPELHRRYLTRSLIEEAITSSQLEGASTTRQVAKEMLQSGRLPRTLDERIIANNYRAMELIRERVDQPLSMQLLLELHRVLMTDTLESSQVGRLRTSREAIFVHDNATGEVLHAPPRAKELPERLKSLWSFANDPQEDTFIHPVVRAIVLHFALAYEHPFTDGNGRTARALFYWSMLRQGYRHAELLPISRIFKAAPTIYARAFALTETDRGDMTYFLLHQLEALQKAIGDFHTYHERKQDELRETDQLLDDDHALNHRQRSVLRDALRRPSLRYTILSHQRQSRIVYQTARTDLLGLVEAGFFRKRLIGRALYFDPVKGLEALLRQRRTR